LDGISATPLERTLTHQSEGNSLLQLNQLTLRSESDDEQEKSIQTMPDCCPSFYADRAARRDRDHRDSRGPVVTGAKQIQVPREGYQLHVELSAMGHGGKSLRQRRSARRAPFV